MDFSLYLQNWMEDPATRATGALAMVLFVLSMLFKSEKRVKLGLALGNLFAVYHLWALGSTVAALISMAAFIRLGLSAWVDPKSKSGFPLAVGFSIFYVVVSIAFYKAPLDLLAFVGTMVNTWAVFLLTGVRFRAALALGMTIWVAFDFSVGAVEMAVASFLSALAAFYAWGREWRLAKSSNTGKPGLQGVSSKPSAQGALSQLGTEPGTQSGIKGPLNG